MKYLDGRLIMIGDQVDLGGGMSGVVICSFDDDQYAPGFPASDWKELKKGVLVQSMQAGLIHFSEPDVDLVLLERKPL